MAGAVRLAVVGALRPGRVDACPVGELPQCDFCRLMAGGGGSRTTTAKRASQALTWAEENARACVWGWRRLGTVIAELGERIADLTARFHQNASNSSRPPPAPSSEGY